MARVTYIGRASRIRIPDGIVLERNVTVEIPNELARGLPPADFDVVMPTRRAPAKVKRTTTAAAKRASAHKKES